MKTHIVIIGVLLISPKVAFGQVSQTNALFEIDCQGVEHSGSGGTIAKERRCMEIVADRILGDEVNCTSARRDAGGCPPQIAGIEPFSQLIRQDCTDADIPAGHGRCLYGRGDDHFANASCIGPKDPVKCCDGAASGTCPALPTCTSALWGQVSRNLDTGADLLCEGSEPWVTFTGAVGRWYPFLIEAAERVTIAGLPACDATNEGLGHVVTDGAGAADCTVGGSTNLHSCRCLSGTWTAEAGQHQVWPPSGSLFGVDAVADLPPCNADTNNLRAWVAPGGGFGNTNRPWVDGTLYRCSNPTWAPNVGNYRVSVNDAGPNDIARPWCKEDNQRPRNCWFPAPPDAPSAVDWVRDQGRDVLLRYWQQIYDGKQASGQDKVNVQRSSETEDP